MINSVRKYLKSKAMKFYIWVHEASYKKKLKYMYLNEHSDTLLIIFSGFGVDNTRLYNYVKSLWELKCDKLYILDNYGYRGSYYWYEGGSDYPEKLVIEFLRSFIAKNSYKKIYTGGSSKGGTAAIYFGLSLDVDGIFAGACQYRIGDYLSLPKHKQIFYGMMGASASSNEKNELNMKLPDLLNSKKESTTIVHLLYSKKEIERTYQDDMIYLIQDLHKNSIRFTEQEENFLSHGEIGLFFPNFVIRSINKY